MTKTTTTTTTTTNTKATTTTTTNTKKRRKINHLAEALAADAFGHRHGCGGGRHTHHY